MWRGSFEPTLASDKLVGLVDVLTFEWETQNVALQVKPAQIHFRRLICITT